MDLGLHIVNFSFPDAPRSIAPTLGAVAAAGEEIGAVHLSLMDHFFQLPFMGMKAEDEMLEGYTALGFLAARTSKATLGLLVTGVTYHHPGLLAKIITTLDVLSGGRAQLGIGAAWYEREHAAMGVAFPPIKERLERLEETLQICLQMWSDNNGPYEGKHYKLAETLCCPRPLQAPHPPILIGGAGEKVLLRMVARYADACNLFSAMGVDGLAHKLAVLRGHCDAEKRDYGAIRKTVIWAGSSPVDDPEHFLREAEAFSKLGLVEMILMPTGPDPVAWVERFAPIARRLADIG
jgi:F420-dependent oxidoreductase-like protein